MRSAGMSPIPILILIIWIFSLLFMVSLPKRLSTLLAFSKTLLFFSYFYRISHCNHSVCGHCLLSVLCMVATWHSTHVILEKTHLSRCNWPHCRMRTLRWSTCASRKAGAPKPDDFSLQQGTSPFCFQPLQSAVEARFLIPKGKSHGSLFFPVTCQWASVSPGEPVKHVPATLCFDSVSLGLDPGICSII